MTQGCNVCISLLPSLLFHFLKTFAVNVKNGEATFPVWDPGGERFREGRIGEDPFNQRMLSAVGGSHSVMAAGL